MFRFHLFLLINFIFSTQAFLSSKNSTNICGTNATRLCLIQSNKMPITGLVFLIVVPVIIILIILRACIPCCRSRYKDETSTNSFYQSRVGAAVSATHTLRA